MTYQCLSDLNLSDPDFGKFDILLGVDIYTEVLLQGRRKGPTGSISSVAFETTFGWVLAGKTGKPSTPPYKITNYHVSVIKRSSPHPTEVLGVAYPVYLHGISITEARLA